MNKIHFLNLDLIQRTEIINKFVIALNVNEIWFTHWEISMNNQEAWFPKSTQQQHFYKSEQKERQGNHNLKNRHFNSWPSKTNLSKSISNMFGKLKSCYERLADTINSTTQNSISFCDSTQKSVFAIISYFHGDTIWICVLCMANEINSRLINVNVVIMHFLVRAIPEGPAKAKNIAYKLVWIFPFEMENTRQAPNHKT